MSAHDCKTLTTGCYRCDLHRDEIQAYIDSLRVTMRGVVHDPDCTYVSGPCSGATRWYPQDGARACARCLPDGLPTPAASSAASTAEEA